MKIVIAGAGEVGFHLAKLLTYESQEIYVIDTDAQKLAYVESHIDVKTVQGDAASLDTLKEANVMNADLLIAITDSQNTNFVVAILGKKLGAKTTVARVVNIKTIEQQEELGVKEIGIDYLISPELLAAKEINLLIKSSGFNDSFEFENGELNVIGSRLSYKSPSIDKRIRDVAKEFQIDQLNTIAIRRDGSSETLIPRGDTYFRENDQVYFVATKEGISDIYTVTGKEKTEYKDVMILGGGRVGQEVGKFLSAEGYNIKLLESDKEKAFEAADVLPKVLVVHGDGRDVELLEEEHIREMDVFVAATGSSETNIMSCMVAKNRGVKRTIAQVDNMDYFKVSQNIGIDTLVNKKLLAASEIFSHIRKGNVIAIANLHNIDAEVLELEATLGSKVTKKPIGELKFNKRAILGGIVRDGKGMIAHAGLQIEVGDKVLVFSDPEVIQDVEKFFG